MFPFFGKNKKSEEQTISPTQIPSVQDFYPIVDIHNSIKVRRDGHLLAAIAIEPYNISLLSEKEQIRKILSLNEVFNGFARYFQQFCIGRPVDLDGYIAELRNKMEAEVNVIKKRIIQNQIKKAARVASGGEVLERKFYLLFTEVPSKMAREELIERIREVGSELTQRNLRSHLCTDKELLELEFLFTHPSQAAYERVPEYAGYYLPPQLQTE